jgi:hypothetical protein
MNMHPIFKKLNLREEKQLLILNAPSSFEPVIGALDEAIDVHRTIEGTYSFILAFVENASAIQATCVALKERMEDDVKLWLAYPKKSSKKYTTDINRDFGWQPLGDMGFEGVRQVAIDQDWSALRFRNVDFIKNMKRDKSRAMSTKGRKRVD